MAFLCHFSRYGKSLFFVNSNLEKSEKKSENYNFPKSSKGMDIFEAIIKSVLNFINNNNDNYRYISSYSLRYNKNQNKKPPKTPD